jgi:hypothetical protein
MAEIFEAICLRDTVQDNPYQFFTAGKHYMISEDSPVRIHFKRADGKDEAKPFVEPHV